MKSPRTIIELENKIETAADISNSTDPCPTLHYKPSEHPIGDVHPFYQDGIYYLNYLYNPGTFNCAQLQSRNLIHWKRVEIEHPGLPDEDTVPPYFGLSIIQDPISLLYRTYYVYHGVRTSTSRDLIHWAAAEPHLVMPVQKEGYDRQSDPYVFWNEAEKCYWMLLTLRRRNLLKEKAGAIGYATSSDLVHWDYQGELYYPGDVGDPECPSMFTMNGNWYLLASYTDRGVGRPSYRISDHPRGPWRILQPDCLDGNDLCAAESCFDGKQRLLFGWIPLTITEPDKQHWGGHLAMPREIYTLPDGSLATRLEKSVGKNIRGALLVNTGMEALQPASGTWHILKENGRKVGQGESCCTRFPGEFSQLDLDVTLSQSHPGGRSGVWIENIQTDAGIEVSLDLAHRRLDIRTFQGSVLSKIQVDILPHQSVKMRVILEEDIVECFLDDRYSLAARLPVPMQPAHLGLFCQGGQGRFEDFQIHALKHPAECQIE